VLHRVDHLTEVLSRSCRLLFSILICNSRHHLDFCRSNLFRGIVNISKVEQSTKSIFPKYLERRLCCYLKSVIDPQVHSCFRSFIRFCCKVSSNLKVYQATDTRRINTLQLISCFKHARSLSTNRQLLILLWVLMILKAMPEISINFLSITTDFLTFCGKSGLSQVFFNCLSLFKF